MRWTFLILLCIAASFVIGGGYGPPPTDLSEIEGSISVLETGKVELVTYTADMLGKASTGTVAAIDGRVSIVETGKVELVTYTADMLGKASTGTVAAIDTRVENLESASVTPYIVPFETTVTLSLANGPWQAFAPTNNVTINIADGASNTIDSVRLDLVAGTHTVTLGTNNVTWQSFTVATNDTTSILYDSQWNKATWRAWELETP